MTYAILGWNSVNVCQTEENDPLHKISWEFEGRKIASFLSATGANKFTNCLFGENHDGYWFIQGKIYNADDNQVANKKEVIHSIFKDIHGVTKKYWGTYLIITFNKYNKEFVILTEPCGQFPTYYTLSSDGQLHLGDSITNFSRYGGIPLEIRNDYIYHYLAFGYGNMSDTGWKGISILPPGYAMKKTLTGKIALSRIWTPIIKKTQHQRPIELLSNILDAQFKNSCSVTLELSGGIDSTSIAVALKNCKFNFGVTALTYYDPMRKASNEVEIAKSVAAYCNMPIEIYPLLRQLPFAPSRRSPPVVARPSPKLCFLAQLETQSENGIPNKMSTLINGHGGDALFLNPPPFCSPVDIVSNFEIKNAIKSIYNLAKLYRLPLAVVFKNLFLESTSFFSGYVNQYISDAIMLPEKKFLSIGLYDDSLKDIFLLLRPARRSQISSLGSTIEETIVQISPSTNRSFFPFLSQPMVELALSLNIKDFFSGYQDRLPLRQSTYDVSKLMNIWRKDKGDTTHSVLQGVNSHLSYVQENCLDGYCVKNGWINRTKFNRLIKRASLGYPEGLAEITRVFSIEMFIQGKDE